MSDQDEQPEHEQHFRVEGMVPTGDAIITARFDRDDSHTYDGYVSSGGYTALRKALTEMSAATVHNEIKLSEIQGRGGAGFPAGIKWGFLPEGVYPRYVVVNGDESEPGTYKDRMLMERDPHQLIEGTVLTCYAVDAAQAFLYVRGEMALAQERLAQALNEAYERNLVGRNVLGSDFSVDITLTWGAGAYIVGEETALIESLEGERGMPRLKPPFFPAVKGLYLQPTIVNNVETLSNLPHILNDGVDAFKALGHEADTGTFLFSVSGHVEKPGNYELPHGLTWRELIFDVAGGIPNGRKLKTWIPGGASAPWFVPPDHLDLPITKDDTAKAGSMLGSGAVVVMNDSTCVVRAAERVVRFFAHESCGQCTPCREGTSWLELILRRIESGQGREVDPDLLLDVSDNISVGLAWPPKMTTICPLGPSAVSPIISIIKYFKDEVMAHIHDGRCPLIA